MRIQHAQTNPPHIVSRNLAFDLRPPQTIPDVPRLSSLCVCLGQSATALMFARAKILCECENCRRLLAGFPRRPQTIFDIRRQSATKGHG